MNGRPVRGGRSGLAEGDTASISRPPDSAHDPGLFVQLRVWDWQDAIAADPALSGDLCRFALTIARNSSGLTGRHVRINRAAKRELLALGEATVNRRVQALVRHGYLVRTAAPKPNSEPEYAMFGPARFDPRTLIRNERNHDQRTEITVTPDHDQRTEITLTRNDDQGFDVDADHDYAGQRSASTQETEITVTPDGDQRSPVDADQNRGVSLITTTRNRDHHKAKKQETSSSQPVRSPTREGDERADDEKSKPKSRTARRDRPDLAAATAKHRIREFGGDTR